MSAEKIIEELKRASNYERAILSQRYFKTGEGEYGEGDLFMGVTVPAQRKIAKLAFKTSLDEVQKLLQDKRHECRLTALIILVEQFKRSRDVNHRKKIVELYLGNTIHINNWDLVDSSAHYILGQYLEDKERTILYQLAESDNLWEQRISIISTFHFIRNDDYNDSLLLAEKLLHHKHDLMHKAVGWMLREVGKRNKSVLVDFLMQYSKQMPRTMLRYAIEKFDEEERQFFMKRETI